VINYYKLFTPNAPPPPPSIYYIIFVFGHIIGKWPAPCSCHVFIHTHTHTHTCIYTYNLCVCVFYIYVHNIMCVHTRVVYIHRATRNLGFHFTSTEVEITTCRFFYGRLSGANLIRYIIISYKIYTCIPGFLPVYSSSQSTVEDNIMTIIL
jgi:hypothetical protein